MFKTYLLWKQLNNPFKWFSQVLCRNDKDDISFLIFSMALFDEKKMTFWIFHSCPRECFWSAGWSLVTLLSVPNRWKVEELQWRTPKRIRMNIRQTNSRKLNLSCKKRKSKNCDMEEDGTKMSIVLTVQTGLSPGVCGPLKMAWRNSLGAWNKLTFTPVSSE